MVQPKNVAEIKKVLAFANEKNIPVIPRGAASWGFGGVIPTKAGIVVDLSPFRNIIEINPEQKTARVEAGARWSDIDIVAKKQGLSLMTYPSSKFSQWRYGLQPAATASTVSAIAFDQNTRRHYEEAANTL